MQIVADGFEHVDFSSKTKLLNIKQDEANNEPDVMLFGDFSDKDYNKFFSSDITVQFLCDTYNATKTWVEEGQKHMLDFEPVDDELMHFGEDRCVTNGYEAKIGNYPCHVQNNCNKGVNGINECNPELEVLVDDLAQLNISEKEVILQVDGDSSDSMHGCVYQATNDLINGDLDDDKTSKLDVDDLQNIQSEGTDVCQSTGESTVENLSGNVVNGSITGNISKQAKSENLKEVDHDQSQKKSWASLFKTPDTTSETVANSSKSTRPAKLEIVMPDQEVVAKEIKDETSLSMIAMENDERANKLAYFISHWYPDYSRTHIKLHGLINRANWCYINASLQALLAIPAIYHFFKNLKEFLNRDAKVTSTPLTDSMIDFFNKFDPFEVHSSGKKESEELNYGAAFEPKAVYQVLSVMKSSLSEKGRQEDAEEFLSFLLNGIHDELVALNKLVQPKSNPAELTNGDVHDCKESDEDTWEEVGPKNKVRTIRKAVIEGSLIKHIFGGVICSSVLQTGVKESTTFQPFFTLQLDIQSENIQTLSNAIEFYFMKEKLQGFTCARTKAEVEASRRISLEELPLMFIFHLKYFIFDRKGGSQKLHKEIDIPVDLEIPRDIISNIKTVAMNNLRRYKLHAIVYHHGRHAAGGHYTAAVHHGNPFGWIHFDDNQIKALNMNESKHLEGAVPYLLFYERIQHR